MKKSEFEAENRIQPSPTIVAGEVCTRPLHEPSYYKLFVEVTPGRTVPHIMTEDGRLVPAEKW